MECDNPIWFMGIDL